MNLLVLQEENTSSYVLVEQRSRNVEQYILGFHTRGETAILVYKTMAKCRLSFA